MFSWKVPVDGVMRMVRVNFLRRHDLRRAIEAQRER